MLMYICDELMDKVSNSEIVEFLKTNGIKNPNDERYPKDRKEMFYKVVEEGIITEDVLSDFFYSRIMFGDHRLMRVYKLSELSANQLRERIGWTDFMQEHNMQLLSYDLILEPVKFEDETLKLLYVKEYRDRLKRKLFRVDMIFAFKALKLNRNLEKYESINSYIPITIDLKNRELIIKVCNQTGLVESSRPNTQLDNVFNELHGSLHIQLDLDKAHPENVLYDMSRDLFDNFYKQLPNIKDIEKKKESMDVIADLLLRDVTLNNISKDVSGHIHMNKSLIDLEDELYKLLQQTALVDYLETEELSALLPENEIYISKIRFSDQDNLEASLTGENGMDCIYDKRTFMGIRNSLDIVKRICSMKVIFPQKKTDLAVKYEVISDKYMIVHILDGKHYNSDEFAEAWELYRKYEKKRINGHMLAKRNEPKSTAM